MNKDFHYYGTYAAARIAGYTVDEAKIIAYSAQYVDECDKSMLKNIEGFKQVPTVQGDSEITKYTLNPKTWTESQLDDVRLAWMPFHFLPGNFAPEHHQYRGLARHEGNSISGKWEYNDEQKKLFKLMCCSNSNTVKEMINQTAGVEQPALELIGLRMHVLADTWAHQYFVGVPCWFINETSEILERIHDDGVHLNINEYSLYSPPALRFDGVFYLGHGRMGHIPDWGYMHYKFKPQWNGNNAIEKNNPQEFLRAFTQMVQAMKDIKQKRKFDVNTYAELDAGKAAALIKIFKTRKKDQCETWVQELRNLTGDNAIPEFDKKAWNTNAEAPDSHYRHFQKAANAHIEFLNGYLSENGLSMTSKLSEVKKDEVKK